MSMKTQLKTWDAAKVVLRGQFTAIQSYLKKKKERKTRNRQKNFIAKTTRKRRRKKSSRRKEIIKI